MSPELAEFFRWAYAVLAIVCATGFIATLIIRWEDLDPWERIIRAGLILEHLVITYAAYVALKPPSYPPTIVGAMLTASMVIIVLGFAVWIADALQAYALRRARL
jgi:hypothetical protein